MPKATVRARNDPAQYDDLAAEWWRPGGSFAMLQWIAAARAGLVPPADRPDAVLVDLGCGGGLMAPHLTGKGYRHVGVDVTASALAQAARTGVTAVRGDVTAVPTDAPTSWPPGRSSNTSPTCPPPSRRPAACCAPAGSS